MVKKCFLIFLCIVVVFTIFKTDIEASALNISASSAIVMVAQTGEVLYEKNAYKRRSMASTTKIMTALLALELCDLSEVITVDEKDIMVEGTSMGLSAGDKVTYEALVYGMLLQSGNDAANVVASKIGGETELFVALMNKRADEIGMKNTNFVTPSGLDADEHYTTAYDMALLGSVAVYNYNFRKISSQKKATISFGNPPQKRTVTNHNKMLSYYDGCIGLKTGYTKKSGRCLVSSALRDGVVLVVVTLNAPDDWNDHKILLDYGFSKTEKNRVDVNQKLNISVVGGEEQYVYALPENDIYIHSKDQSSDYRIDYLIDDFVYAPIKKGDNIGKAICYVSGKRVAEVMLIADRSIDQKKFVKSRLNFFTKFRDFLKSVFK